MDKKPHDGRAPDCAQGHLVPLLTLLLLVGFGLLMSVAAAIVIMMGPGIAFAALLAAAGVPLLLLGAIAVATLVLAACRGRLANCAPKPCRPAEKYPPQACTETQGSFTHGFLHAARREVEQRRVDAKRRLRQLEAAQTSTGAGERLAAARAHAADELGTLKSLEQQIDAALGIELAFSAGVASGDER